MCLYICKYYRLFIDSIWLEMWTGASIALGIKLYDLKKRLFCLYSHRSMRSFFVILFFTWATGWIDSCIDCCILWLRSTGRGLTPNTCGFVVIYYTRICIVPISATVIIYHYETTGNIRIQCFIYIYLFLNYILCLQCIRYCIVWNSLDVLWCLILAPGSNQNGLFLSQYLLWKTINTAPHCFLF